jgi:hypothetical protein
MIEITVSPWPWVLAGLLVGYVLGRWRRLTGEKRLRARVEARLEQLRARAEFYCPTCDAGFAPVPGSGSGRSELTRCPLCLSEELIRYGHAGADAPVQSR